ncbi:MAG: hypothetical protein CFE24_13860 [Flavobacterium sp. BFFFF2]|nr:MAG: hypothetical protein CFE24_13860 [Flavobacterium sp. BFFFF2]
MGGNIAAHIADPDAVSAWLPIFINVEKEGQKIMGECTEGQRLCLTRAKVRQLFKCSPFVCAWAKRGCR